LCQRAVGEGTDVVDKEMYTSTTKRRPLATLRPEATASSLRAYFEGGLHQAPQPVRMRYWGHVSLHRPQAALPAVHLLWVEAIGEAAPGWTLR